MLTLEMEEIECDCGFGEGFFHASHDGTHYFKPDGNDYIATFYGHIDGRYAILTTSYFDIYENYSYKKYGGKKGAYQAIVRRIKEIHSQSSFCFD